MSSSASDILRGVRSARYQTLLKTFEWREFSQRMKRAKGSRCEVCRRKHDLQTHHNFYDAERLPWEYEAAEVRVLCGICHEGIEEGLKNFRKFVAPLLTPEQFKLLNGALLVGLSRHERSSLLTALVELVGEGRLVSRLAELGGKGSG